MIHTFIEYFHDPLGRRIAKKVNSTITKKYLWQGRARLLAVYDGTDNLLMRFSYADTRTPVAVQKQGATYYLGFNHVGSLRAVADSSGNMIKEITYDSFGRIINDTNPDFEIPIGFAAGLHDRDTGLVRFGHRDYDPDTGRWTAKDPILFSGGDTNLYGYVLNDPVNLVDPDGRLAFTGSVAFGFLAAKALGIGIAWGGLQTASHIIGNPELPTDKACGNYHLSNYINDVTGGIAVFNAGLGAGLATAEVGIAMYPEVIVAAGTPQGQRLLLNSRDFINATVPSTTPSPNLPGLAGHITGEAFSRMNHK